MTTIPKAPRPTFFEDPAIDRLTAIVTALTTEVAVLSERVHSLEASLAEKFVLSVGEIDARQLSPAELGARGARQEALNQRVFYVLQEELDALSSEG